MFHITLPAAVAGALFAAGTAATATVLYTSGPLSGGDSPAPPLAAATLTPSATVTTGPTGTPAPTGTLPPCIPGTPGATPAPCRPPGDQSLPPPPGVPGANFTPGPITVVPLPTPQGLRPYTPGPTAPMPPFGPTSFPTVEPLTVEVGRMWGIDTASNLVRFWLAELAAPTCTRACKFDPDPQHQWQYVLERCANIPAAGYSWQHPEWWLPEFLAVDRTLRATCNSAEARAKQYPGEVVGTELRTLAGSMAATLTGAQSALAQGKATRAIATEADLRVAVQAEIGRPR